MLNLFSVWVFCLYQILFFFYNSSYCLMSCYWYFLLPGIYATNIATCLYMHFLINFNMKWKLIHVCTNNSFLKNLKKPWLPLSVKYLLVIVKKLPFHYELIFQLDLFTLSNRHMPSGSGHSINLPSLQFQI